MKRLLLSTAVVAGAWFFGHFAMAAPIIFNFTGAIANANQDLGTTEAYTQGSTTINAAAGVAAGAAPPSAGDGFSNNGDYHLVGNNRGLGEQGLGVCMKHNNPCSGASLDGEIGEIDRATNDVVQLNISALYALFTNFTISADSTTNGEIMGVFQSNSATNLGTLLLSISADGPALITPTMNYLYFASIGPAASGGNGGNVLLHSFTITPDVDINPNAVLPEPATLAVLGMGLLGLGVAKRRRV